MSNERVLTGTFEIPTDKWVWVPNCGVGNINFTAMIAIGGVGPGALVKVIFDDTSLSEVVNADLIGCSVVTNGYIAFGCKEVPCDTLQGRYKVYFSEDDETDSECLVEDEA